MGAYGEFMKSVMEGLTKIVESAAWMKLKILLIQWYLYSVYFINYSRLIEFKE